MPSLRILHLTTHLNMGGITQYILRLVKPLKVRSIGLTVAASGGELARSLEEAGARVLELPIRTKSELSPRIYLALPKVLQILRQEKIKAIHAHTRVTQVLAALASGISGVPYVTTCHGFYKRRLGRRIFPAWGRQVIAISEGVSDFLRQDFQVPPEQIALIHNAVDIEALDRDLAKQNTVQNKKRFGFNPSDPVIGVVARLVKDKGHEFLLQAIHRLSGKFPRLGLLIVGEGRERKDLEALSRKLGLETRVVFAGTVQDITDPLSAIDLFALPATWREGFGLSIVEAMVCRKPVIVTNIRALNTLIRNEETGLLIPPSDIDALSSAMDRLLTDPALRDRLANRGRQVAEELFGIDRFADQIASLYRECLTEKTHAGHP